MDLEEQIWQALREIEDPELPVAITDLGLVRDVRVEEGRVLVRLIPTYSACPAMRVIGDDIRRRLLALEGVREVSVEVTYDEPWTVARMTEEGRRRLTAHGLSVPRRGTWEEPVTCPFCGSTQTTLENLFGPTLCRAIYYCRACGNPIERFKPPLDSA
ncbi:MAG: phenylacetate-CoA oxygenase subunit PaaJ [Armatimonadetes bacterium]|nr:phenylacetate-CoA oxygenase subunit PaaJ [Armatimonadota bacterium]